MNPDKQHRDLADSTAGERRPACSDVVMRFAQVSYGSVDSDAHASSAWRLSTVHDTVELFSLIPNELKWLQREPV